MSSTAIGQDIQKYAGTMKLGEYEGEAEYGYKIVGTDTLLEGAFKMQRSNLQALLEKNDTSFSFSGTFEDDYPEGFWQFQFGKFQSESKTEVVDFEYRVAVSGVQERTSGLVTKGKPNGKWTYTVEQIKNSEVEKTLFKSDIEFDKGIPRRNFSIQGDNNTLVGRFLRNGLAHDEWSLYNGSEPGETEDWIFDDGLLKEVRSYENGTAHTTEVFESSSIGTDTKIINLDSGYIKILKIQQQYSSDSTLVFDGKIPGLLRQNAAYYKKIDSILSQLGQSSFLPEFKVRVPYFPLDSVEIIQLDTINERLQNATAISNSFLNDTHLNILKLSDDEAMYYYSLIQAISENFLSPLTKLIQYREEGILDFVKREKLMQNLWPNGFPSKDISVRLATGSDTLSRFKVFELQNASAYSFDGENLTKAEQLTKYAAASLAHVEQVLGAKLTKEKQQQELIALEEELIVQNKALQQLIDSIPSTLAPKYRRAINHIKSVSDKSLEDFSKHEQLNGAEKLVDCYEQMNMMAKAILALPEQMEEINTAYNDRVWNPFMATLMNEEVKKRITSAYRKNLIPYFLEQINANLSCDSVSELVALIENTHRRMLQLRNEDTARIERKLRKEQDPLKIMQLFNVQVETKEN